MQRSLSTNLERVRILSEPSPELSRTALERGSFTSIVYYVNTIRK